VLVDVWQIPLAWLLHSWKGFIAHKVNKLLGRTGKFWEREYWDIWMKSDAQLAKSVRYTERNPIMAGLASVEKDWSWSSARFRNEAGVLRLPIGAPAFSRLSDNDTGRV